MGDLLSGVVIVGGPRVNDPSWNIPEVQSTPDSVCGRRAACAQSVPTSHRANVIASDVINLSAPAPRPPPPVNAHHHITNDFFNPHRLVNVTNNVPNMPVYPLNAQNDLPLNKGRINCNSHACNNVPNWSRSVDILKALNHAVPHNSSSHVDERIAYNDIRQTSTVRRPIFDIYAAPGDQAKENGESVDQNSDVMLYQSIPEEANSSCVCVPISIPRVSSWSFTKKNVATTPTALTNRHDLDTHQYAMNKMIKIQSADNIKRLQYINSSIPSTSGQIDSGRAIYPLNNNDNAIYRQQSNSHEAICNQPMPLPMPVNKHNVFQNTPKNSVVHWTSSVENRVCCPETVLYGAVYGLKCLK